MGTPSTDEFLCHKHWPLQFVKPSFDRAEPWGVGVGPVPLASREGALGLQPRAAGAEAGEGLGLLGWPPSEQVPRGNGGKEGLGDV